MTPQRIIHCNLSDELTVVHAHGLFIAKEKGGTIPQLARSLIFNGYALFDDVLEVYRDEMLIFHPAPLHWWATKTIAEGALSARLVPWKPHPETKAWIPALNNGK